MEKIEEVRVSRSRIIEYLNENFFEEFILDMFVRVHTKNQVRRARCEMCGVRALAGFRQGGFVSAAMICRR